MGYDNGPIQLAKLKITIRACNWKERTKDERKYHFYSILLQVNMRVSGFWCCAEWNTKAWQGGVLEGVWSKMQVRPGPRAEGWERLLRQLPRPRRPLPWPSSPAGLRWCPACWGWALTVNGEFWAGSSSGPPPRPARAGTRAGCRGRTGCSPWPACAAAVVCPRGSPPCWGSLDRCPQATRSKGRKKQFINRTLQATMHKLFFEKKTYLGTNCMHFICHWLGFFSQKRLHWCSSVRISVE